jgi:hypothetical protein
MTQEALKLALEALEGAEALLLSMGLTHLIVYGDAEKAITTIKEALAQPKQFCGFDVVLDESMPPNTFKLVQPGQEPVRREQKMFMEEQEFYATPPQRTWVGLTANELNMIGHRMRTWNSHSLADVYVAIEAKLKQKNSFAEENT